MSSFFGVKIIILFNRKKSQNECSSILSYSNIDNFLKDLFFSYNFLFFQSFLIVGAAFNFNLFTFGRLFTYVWTCYEISNSR